MNLVLDASAGFELLVHTEAGESLQHKLPFGATWWVPEHYYIEVAAVLRRAELGGKLAQSDTADAFERLHGARGPRRRCHRS